MGVIHCCGGLRKCRSFILEPQDGYFEARLDWLESCPTCSHTVLQLTRIDFNNEISVIRKTNQKARKLRDRLQAYILNEIDSANVFKNPSGSGFYLMYNDFGKMKKCYSNLSRLKIGLSENAYMKSNNRILNFAFAG